MRYLFNTPDNVREWVSAKLGMPKVGDDKFSAIGIVKDNELEAGAVFHNYTGYSVELSFASESPRWCTKGVLQTIYKYVFVQLGCERFQAVTAKKNKQARKALEKIGFVYEGKARKGYDGKEDAVIYSLLKEEAVRWVAPQ